MDILNVNDLEKGQLVLTHDSNGKSIYAVIFDLDLCNMYCVNIDNNNIEIIDGDITYELGAVQIGQIDLIGNAEQLSIGDSFNDVFGDKQTLDLVRRKQIQNTLQYIKSNL